MAGELSVEIAAVSKRFGSVAAVDRVSLGIRRGEFFALLGPSGCGKTTLLRLLAGLELPDGGTVRIDGEDMTRVPPHRRPVNLVFQHYALFPHLSVAENVAFGLRYRGVPRREESDRVAAALALVRLAGFEARHPHQLSGGQRQRVALARALALEPKVLLLDEPLGALDQKLRREMQVELKKLQRAVGITFVFVTHDQEEALVMSDTLAVMQGGRIEQAGGAAEVFERPETAFVAEFLGAPNFFVATVEALAAPATLTAGEEAGDPSRRTLRLRLAGGERLDLPAAALPPLPPLPPELAWPGRRLRLVVRPEKLQLHLVPPPAPPGGLPAVPVVVEERVYQGASTSWVVVDARGGRFEVVAQNSGAASSWQPEAGLDERGGEEAGAALRPGLAAFLCWHPRHTVVLREEG